MSNNSSSRIVIDLTNDTLPIKEEIRDRKRIGIDLTTDVESRFIIKVSKILKTKSKKSKDIKGNNRNKKDDEDDEDDDELFRYILLSW